MARIFGPAAILLAALAAAAPGGARAQAPAASPSPGWQATPWADSVMLQSQLRFELESPNGVGVSEQQWKGFLSDTILARFPDTVTVIDGMAVTRTSSAGVRIVLILHPNTPDALGKVGEIATAYAQRFGGAKVMRLDTPVRTGN